MDILILRHGEAVDAEQVGGRDQPRTLTTQGREQSERAARGLRRLGWQPGAVLTSPYPRAVETAQITARVLGREELVTPCKQLAPGGDPSELIEVFNQNRHHECVMLVGHNPDLEELVAALIAPDGDASIKLKKGGVATLQATDPIRNGTAVLTGLWACKQLIILGEGG